MTAATPIPISDPDDARLAPYRHLKDAAARGPSTFIAESEIVVRKLLASRLDIESILVTAPRWDSLAGAVRERRIPPPVYLAAQEVLDCVAGLHVHRGCLGIGRRPATVAVPDGARLVLALEDLVDVDNLGGIVRNACAFGVDALLLSPRCADPYYRKAIRVAAGNTFALPIVRAERWPEDLLELRRRLGAWIVAAVVDSRAMPLDVFFSPPGPDRPLVLLLGSEGPGLQPETQALADARVTIPMAAADSLNVATACAVFLYEATRGSITAAKV